MIKLVIHFLWFCSGIFQGGILLENSCYREPLQIFYSGGYELTEADAIAGSTWFEGYALYNNIYIYSLIVVYHILLWLGSAKQGLYFYTYSFMFLIFNGLT